MAKAEIRDVPPVPVQPEQEVVLTLTLEEASILRALTGACKSRGVTSPIYRALLEAGVTSDGYSTKTSYGYATITVEKR